MSRTQQKGSPVHHNKKKQDYNLILRQFQYFQAQLTVDHYIHYLLTFEIWDVRFYNAVCHHLLTRVTSLKACWSSLSGNSHSKNISINTEARSKSQATHIYTALHTAPLHRDPDCSYQVLTLLLIDKWWLYLKGSREEVSLRIRTISTSTALFIVCKMTNCFTRYHLNYPEPADFPLVKTDNTSLWLAIILGSLLLTCWQWIVCWWMGQRCQSPPPPQSSVWSRLLL